MKRNVVNSKFYLGMEVYDCYFRFREIGVEILVSLMLV